MRALGLLFGTVFFLGKCTDIETSFSDRLNDS